MPPTKRTSWLPKQHELYWWVIDTLVRHYLTVVGIALVVILPHTCMRLVCDPHAFDMCNTGIIALYLHTSKTCNGTVSCSFSPAT
jgi:hypothetical protein